MPLEVRNRNSILKKMNERLKLRVLLNLPLKGKEQTLRLLENVAL